MNPRKKKIETVDITQAGKVPPQNTELEVAVLGIIMLEKAAFDVVTDIIKTPEYFYLQANQCVFRAMLTLRDNSSFIDMRTVVEQLTKQGELDAVGGAYAVMKMTNGVVHSAALQDYCRVVAEKYMLRQLIVAGGNIVHYAYDGTMDVFDLIDHAETTILAVNTATQGDFNKLDTGLVKVIKKIEDLRHSDHELTGIDTGFREINKLTAGWQKQDFIILAARPSVGKTAFALNLALAAVKGKDHPVAVGFFSMEMSEPQLIQRLLSMQSNVLLEKISRGRLDDQEFALLNRAGTEPLFKVPLYIDDRPALNIYELRSKARKMVSKHKVGLIIVDYLQLMSGIQNNRADNREQEISKISRDLKGLAKELDIPIIALSQLSREVEKRKEGNKMPVLSDLRESGAIEQDADVVMFMYRPEYYGKNVNAEGEFLNGETHIKFAKHRNGALDTIKLRAELKIQKFHDVDSVEQLGLGNGSWKPVDKTPAPVAKMGPYFGNTSDDDNMPF